MYAETGLLFPYYQGFSLEVQQLEDFCQSHKTNPSMGSLVQTSAISEYDLGGEGDLFKAPEPIIEEPMPDLDPLAAAISMISCGENAISSQDLKVVGIGSIEGEQLFSEVFYECKKDLLEKDAVDAPLSEVLDEIAGSKTDENPATEVKLSPEALLQKSISSGCLKSMEWVHGVAPIRPNFLEFPGMDLGAIYGMRRAFSEGDIKTLGNGNGSGNVSLIHCSLGQPHFIGNSSVEDRKQKLSRYRNKKSKRNFGRKIKYACRKALADSQPRIRGRFAKTEEPDYSKKQ